MASEVFLHIGLPKTGTTYLQSLLWECKPELARQSYLLPGRVRREHLWAALELEERPHLARRDPRAVGTLARLVTAINKHRGPAILSHEFMCGAGRDQAGRLVASLGAADVHVVVTARDALGMLTSGWAEYVKNGGTRPLADLQGARFEGQNEFGWRTWDLAGVLRRWGGHVPPAHVHIITMPEPGAPADELWRRFAGVLGLDPDPFHAPVEPRNPALGVAQIELLRRVNPLLTDFRSALDRGTWIRGYLAEQLLVRQGGERLGAGAEQIADCQRRADLALRLIERRGYHVVGDLDRLQVPEQPADRPLAEAVTDAELVEQAITLVAGLLADVRRVGRGEVPDPIPPDLTSGS